MFFKYLFLIQGVFKYLFLIQGVFQISLSNTGCFQISLSNTGFFQISLSNTGCFQISLPNNAPKSVTLETAEPVDEELVISVAEVGDGLQHVSEHCVGGLGGEDRVLKQDQQSTNIVLPEI